MPRSRSHAGVFAFILGVMLMVGTLTLAQNDPFVGTWVLNVRKSQFIGGGPFIRSRTIVIAPKADAFSHVQETFRTGDAGTKISFDAKYDGSDSAVTGGVFNTVAFTRMGRTLTRKGKDFGMEIETATYTLSADGKTLTIVTEGDNRGVTYGSTQVFEKKP